VRRFTKRLLIALLARLQIVATEQNNFGIQSHHTLAAATGVKQPMHTCLCIWFELAVTKSRDHANIKRFLSQEARSAQPMILELAFAGLCRKPSRRLSDQCTRVIGQRDQKPVSQRYVRTLRNAAIRRSNYLTPESISGKKEIAAPHLRQALFWAGPL
jgi:hypothetical protein